MKLRSDYERLVKAGRAYKRALRSAEALYKNDVSSALTALKAAALALTPPDIPQTESTAEDQPSKGNKGPNREE